MKYRCWKYWHPHMIHGEAWDMRQTTKQNKTQRGVSEDGGNIRRKNRGMTYNVDEGIKKFVIVFKKYKTQCSAATRLCCGLTKMDQHLKPSVTGLKHGNTYKG
eukprot:15158216-Ditylum_brightwellii.AAC.1